MVSFLAQELAADQASGIALTFRRFGLMRQVAVSSRAPSVQRVP